MLAMTIGAFSELLNVLSSLNLFRMFFFINRLAFAMGIAVRFALHSKPDTIGIYIFENFFVVLSVSSHMNSSFHLLYTADLCSNN